MTDKDFRGCGLLLAAGNIASACAAGDANEHHRYGWAVLFLAFYLASAATYARLALLNYRTR